MKEDRPVAPELIGRRINNCHAVLYEFFVARINFTFWNAEGELHGGRIRSRRVTVVVPRPLSQTERDRAGAHCEDVGPLRYHREVEQRLVKCLHPRQIVAQKNHIIELLDFTNHGGKVSGRPRFGNVDETQHQWKIRQLRQATSLNLRNALVSGWPAMLQEISPKMPVISGVPRCQITLRQDTMARYRCTPSERLFVALNELGDGEGMIASGIRIRGLVDHDRLLDAVRRLQARHAKLRCRTEYDDKEWPYFVEMNPVVPIHCEFRETTDPEKDAEEVLLHAWPDRFPLDKSGPMQLIVLKCPAKNCTDIIGWFHHSVFDGPAVWELFQELLEAYADPKAHLTPASGGFEVRPRGKPSHWGDLKWFLTAIWHRVILKKFNRPVSFRGRRLEESVSHVRTILSPELTRRIVEACRRENATVTAAVSAAACTIFTRECGWQKRIVSIPTPRDARADFDPPVGKLTLGCFATLYELVLHLPGDDEKFWDYARLHATEAKRQFDEKDPIRALRLIKHIPVKAIKKAERGALMINNLGRVSTAGMPLLPELLDYYGYVRTKTLSAYAVTVTASTTNDQMAISLDTSCFDQPSIERLERALIGLLEQESQPPNQDSNGSERQQAPLLATTTSR